ESGRDIRSWKAETATGRVTVDRPERWRRACRRSGAATGRGAAGRWVSGVRTIRVWNTAAGSIPRRRCGRMVIGMPGRGAGRRTNQAREDHVGTDQKPCRKGRTGAIVPDAGGSARGCTPVEATLEHAREVRLRPLAPGVADPVVAPQDRGFADRAHSGPPTEERMVPFSDETARPHRRRETVEPGERDVAVRPRPLVVAAVLAATSYAGAQLGFAITFSPHPVSTLWLPTAVILASLLLVPPRSWWTLLFAVLPVHLG